MINRTYIVGMPFWSLIGDGDPVHDPAQPTENYLDIILEGVAGRGQGGPTNGRPLNYGANAGPFSWCPVCDVATITTPLYPWLFPANTPYIQAPVNWYGSHGGWYMEWRKRPLRFDPKTTAASASAMGRFQLGWRLSVVPFYWNLGEDPNPPHLGISGHYSHGNADLIPPQGSLFPSRPTPFVYFSLSAASDSAFPDPPYGPVIRLVNSSSVASWDQLVADGGEIIEPSMYLVQLSIIEPKDEDRDPAVGG